MSGKLFPHVEHANSLDLDADLGAALRGAVLSFSLLTDPGVIVTLYALHVREIGKAWRNVIPNVVGDNDGEISVLIGTYAPGTKLELFYGILAVSSAVTRASTYMIRDAKTPSKLAPRLPGEFKKIDRSDRWEDTVAYEVAA